MRSVRPGTRTRLAGHIDALPAHRINRVSAGVDQHDADQDQANPNNYREDSQRGATFRYGLSAGSVIVRAVAVSPVGADSSVSTNQRSS